MGEGMGARVGRRPTSVYKSSKKMILGWGDNFSNFVAGWGCGGGGLSLEDFHRF